MQCSVLSLFMGPKWSRRICIAQVFWSSFKWSINCRKESRTWLHWEHKKCFIKRWWRSFLERLEFAILAKKFSCLDSTWWYILTILLWEEMQLEWKLFWCLFFSFWERTSGVAFFTISSSLKDKSSLQHFPVFLDEKGLMTVFFENALHFLLSVGTNTF